MDRPEEGEVVFLQGAFDLGRYARQVQPEPGAWYWSHRGPWSIEPAGTTPFIHWWTMWSYNVFIVAEEQALYVSSIVLTFVELDSQEGMYWFILKMGIDDPIAAPIVPFSTSGSGQTPIITTPTCVYPRSLIVDCGAFDFEGSRDVQVDTDVRLEPGEELVLVFGYPCLLQNEIWTEGDEKEGGQITYQIEYFMVRYFAYNMKMVVNYA